jgi:hypothetical protein
VNGHDFAKTAQQSNHYKTLLFSEVYFNIQVNIAGKISDSFSLSKNTPISYFLVA